LGRGAERSAPFKLRARLLASPLRGLPGGDANETDGRVTGIRYGERSNEPEVLEVRAGLFGRMLLLISVDEVAEICCRGAPDRPQRYATPDLRMTGRFTPPS
jgi:hypothetical protein